MKEAELKKELREAVEVLLPPFETPAWKVRRLPVLVAVPRLVR